MRRTFLDPVAATSHRFRRLAVIIPLAALGLIALVIGTIGLILGPPDPASPADTSASAPAGRHSVEDEPGRGGDVIEDGLPETDDPEEFAHQVALALFAWDTSDGYMPRDYAEILVEAGQADTGSLNGLFSDVTTYLPTDEAWVELQKYETRQHLVIDQIGVPDRWQDVLEQARDDAIQPGTTAYTIEGTRHRAGVWDGEAVQTQHPVAFTLFVHCAPSGDPCELLRLSALDKPLT